MTITPGDGQGHADNIVADEFYEPARPEPHRAFLPWHLPRKQFVRHHQWCKQIGSMLDSAMPTDGPFRYFGLPGVDLLDLRYFHVEVCEPRGIDLLFLGFNRDAGTAGASQVELNISLDEVRRLPRVDRRSDIIGDDFVSVANERSMAWKRAHELGPYDVINLDLCDGFAKHVPGTFDLTHYNAVGKLLALQSRSKRPWLLLLTTRVGQQHVHPDVREKLIKKYLENLTTCLRFKDVSREHFEIEDALGLDLATASESGLGPVYLCGLCKWLAGIALGQRPSTRIEVKSVIGYRVDQGAEHQDLVSLAFLCTPTFEAPSDPVGLAKAPPIVLDEGGLAVRALRRVAKRKDADLILKQDPDLNERMINATASLLELARYDTSTYREWVLKR